MACLRNANTNRIVWGILLALTFLALGCNSSINLIEPTQTPAATLAPSQISLPLADLVVVSMEIAPETSAPCLESPASLGIALQIQNAGDAAAGSFDVEVNSTRQAVSAGLAAGENLSLWFAGYEAENVVRLDVTGRVAEREEGNNLVARVLPVPTSLPACQATQAVELDILEAYAVLTGHSGRVLSLSFSPDGTLLASGSVDNTLRLWRVESPSLLRTMQGHPFQVLSIAYSPSGSALATGSDDGLVRIWQVSNGSLQHTLQGHAGWVDSLTYAPDGRTLASGASDFTVRLWRTVDGKLVETIDEGMAEITSLAFTPTGDLLTWAERNGTVRMMRVADRSWVHILRGSPGEANCLAVSPTGEFLAIGSSSGEVTLIAVENGERLQSFRAHNKAINAIAISPDGEWLSSASADGTLRLWNLRAMLLEEEVETERRFILAGHTALVNAVAFSPDGSLLASASDDATIRFWSVPEP